MIDLRPIYLTLELSFIVMVLLAIFAIPIARWLAYRDSSLIKFLKSIISLPLVLPPTVLGFYLIIFFNREAQLGGIFESVIGEPFLFTFSGLVFASLIYSLPFMMNPILSGLESLNQKYAKMSRLYGQSKWRTFLFVELPLIRNSIVTGLVLTFAHTIGEFGVILMIGGNIPSETEVASVSIYKHVELMNYDQANMYAVILLLFSISLIFLTQYLKGKKNLL